MYRLEEFPQFGFQPELHNKYVRWRAELGEAGELPLPWQREQHNMVNEPN